MQKIIGGLNVNGNSTGGVLFEGKYNPTSWDVRVFEVNGHREISVRNVIDWVEVCDSQPHLDGVGNLLEPEPLSDDDLEERRLRALERNAKRAQTMVRRVIKFENFDELLTLTYRANQQSRALCKKHFKEWVRRMKRALPGFRYCASFERQERGSMHVHLATHRLPAHALYKGVKIEAWKLGTKVWRSIVGDDNGLCFVGGKSRFGKGRHRKMSLAKMASYVSKYILKDYADSPEESNRYSRSNGCQIPKSVVMRFYDLTLADIVLLCFECGDGDVIVSHRVSESAYWLCTEPMPHSLRFQRCAL